MGMQSQRPVEVQTVILRKHLHELTESFMIPLERYLASLMPLQKNICPCKVKSFLLIHNEISFDRARFQLLSVIVCKIGCAITKTV